MRKTKKLNKQRALHLNERIEVAPLHKDRRIEILYLGLLLHKTDEEVQERLAAENLDTTLPNNYRTDQGELDLLQNWLPNPSTKSSNQ